MTEEERIAIWKANEELQEEMIATRDVRIAALEAENAALRQAAGALQRLDTLPHEQYGEIFIGRNDLGRWNCIVYENLTHGDELVLGTVADEYADTLHAAIEAALAQVGVAGE